MDGNCEVGDEFGSGDEKKQEDDTVGANVLASSRRKGGIRSIPNHGVHHPAETKHPSGSDIASDGAPAEEGICCDIPACDQSGE
jgi:hypothetical protein